MADRRDVLEWGVAAGLGTGAVTAKRQDGGGTTTGQADGQSDGAVFSTGSMSAAAQPSDVESNAQGAALFERRGNRLRFVLLVSRIRNVTQAHVHRGGEGENGPVVVWLYPSPAAREPQRFPGRFDGVLSRGQFDANDFVGPLSGKSTDALVDAIENGNAYVNVHTEANPAGEIRGQLAGVGQSSVRFSEQLEIDASDGGLGVQRSVQLQVSEQS